MNKNINFKHVTELLGYKNFNDFEKEYDNDIFTLTAAKKVL
ncbi:hypothetical protein [Mammaliicoccus sciuri]|nr:hypothetical protein [Mammaliicoccus sciuri]